MASARKVVKGHRGIYVRDTRDGRRYEATYTDSNGKTRWTTHATLKDAEAARAEKVAAKSRGERVAPSKLKLGEYAATWLDTQGHLRPSTLRWYESAIRLHITPKLGHLKLSAVTEDDVAALIAEMRAKGYAAWTIRGVLTPLGRIYSTAVRRGLTPSNPVRRLERGERPPIERREMRVLDSSEIGRLLDATPDIYRPLLATSIFTGTRQGDAGASLGRRGLRARDRPRAETVRP